MKLAGGQDRLAHTDGQRQRVGDDGPPAESPVHDGGGQAGVTPHVDGDRPEDSLQPVRVDDSVHHDPVTPLVGQRGGGGRSTVDEIGDHLQLGKGPSHSVAVHDRDAETGSDHQGHHRVATTHLEGGYGREPPAYVAFQGPHRVGLLVPPRDFFEGHDGRTHAARHHQEVVVCDLGRVDDLDALAGAQFRSSPEPSKIGVAAPAGAEDGRPDRGRYEVLLGYVPHVSARVTTPKPVRSTCVRFARPVKGARLGYKRPHVHVGDVLHRVE